jgi:hypothetical protein
MDGALRGMDAANPILAHWAEAASMEREMNLVLGKHS